MAHMPGDSKGCEKDAGRKYPYCGRAPTLPRQLTLGTFALPFPVHAARGARREPTTSARQELAAVHGGKKQPLDLSQTCPGISMRILSNPYFEASPRSDRRGWVALVTWGHALRHEIDGAIFNCEKEALQWIAENSPQWLARQNAAESRAAAPKATVSRKAKIPTKVPICARPATLDQSASRPLIAAGATTRRARAASAGRTAAAAAR